MKEKRILRVLLIPALAFIFVVGWLLYVSGKSHATPKKVHKAKATEQNKDSLSKAESVEIGVIETILEKNAA